MSIELIPKKHPDLLRQEPSIEHFSYKQRPLGRLSNLEVFIMDDNVLKTLIAMAIAIVLMILLT